MTPESFALVLLLTYLGCTIIDWLFAPRRRVVVVAVVLIVSFLWVYGVPFVIERRG